MRSFFGVLFLFFFFIILEISATGRAHASEFEKSPDGDPFCYKTGITVEEMKLLIGSKNPIYKSKIKDIINTDGASGVRTVHFTIQGKKGLEKKQVQMNPCEDIVSSLSPPFAHGALSRYLLDYVKCYNGSIDVAIKKLNILKADDDAIAKDNVELTRFLVSKVDKNIEVSFHSREDNIGSKKVIIKKCGETEAPGAAPAQAKTPILK